MRRHWTILACALLLTLHAAVATADDTQQQLDPHAARISNDVSQQILSPFCPGKTLAMCPSPAAAEVRMKIQEMASAGMAEDKIKEAIIAEHGEQFRIIEPPWTDNFGLLGALGGGLALAFIAVAVISRRRKGASTDGPRTTPTAEPEPDDPYLADLRKQYRD